jgi:4-carboxymuconolactone decarboxylase
MAHDQDPPRADTMREDAAPSAMLAALDAPTVALVRLAAVLTAGSEAELRAALTDAAPRMEAAWIEELVLQTYLFAGFPRALNAMREWRRLSGSAAPVHDEASDAPAEAFWARGEATCAAVYGDFYAPLRVNIRALHPALDAWMIGDGYGKVLGRPALALWRRELCIIAACAAARQDRQLHAHLHGAINTGASPAQVDAALSALTDLLAPDDLARYRALWARVRQH